jgi:FAD/FMN-containing dehydrogenase
MILSGWGRQPRVDCRIDRVGSLADLLALDRHTSRIARGSGRAYGDSALNRDQTLDMRGLSRLLAFDPTSGQVVAQAGVTLSELIDVFLPRGWFPAVTPGTRHVTIGGAIASDVHGKNHHKHGGFGNFVDWVELLGADGKVRRIDAAKDAELFAWTRGGMGLTGVILRAGLRLVPVETGWIRQRQVPAPNLAHAMEIFERSQEATYSVAWIDCLAGGNAAGRSLVMLGEHAVLSELGADERADPFVRRQRAVRKVPFDFPALVLNPLSVRAFNSLYYANGLRHAGDRLVDYERFFYPLDALHDWNRIYGRPGFAQFQCVLPLAASTAGLSALLAMVRRKGEGSFLAVLKRMGAQEGRFSFPMEGYTLALDFPVRRSTRATFAELERITIDHGGRFYLAKDSFLTAETLRAADTRTHDFVAMRNATGAAGRFASLQSERLQL